MKNWQNRVLPWRNWLARSTVNRKVGGSSPPGSELFYRKVQFRKCSHMGLKTGPLLNITLTTALWRSGRLVLRILRSKRRRSRVGLNHQPFD